MIPDQQPQQPEVPQLDETLTMLASVEPRAGLEGRILANLTSVPLPVPWYQRFSARSWAAASAAGLVAAGLVASHVILHRSPAGETRATPASISSQAPRPAPRPISAAAAMAVPDGPVPHRNTRVSPHGRRRGAVNSFRAEHPHVPLPRGTVAPLHPQMLNPTQ